MDESLFSYHKWEFHGIMEPKVLERRKQPMAKRFDQLTNQLTEFIHNQKMFFVGTAPTAMGELNVSPKGYQVMRVLNNQTLLYLDYYGSGNETANHLHENQRITFMWCSFEEKPLILRVYGKGSVIDMGTVQFDEYMANLFPEVVSRIIRQIFVVTIESVQTSCGWAVPFMKFTEERNTLINKSIEQIK